MAIAFVPVRGGSKSIPLKNIKSFCGRPLVYWVLSALETVSDIEKIIVATDSDKIDQTVSAFGFPKVQIYRRSADNAQDNSSTEAVMLEYLRAQVLPEDEQFMLVQATSPLTRNSDFRESLQCFNTSNADSLLSCVRTKRFFWKEDGTPLNYEPARRPRRQEFDGLLMENGAIYINTVGNIKRDQTRLSGRVMVYEMPDYTAIELDEEDDWPIAEAMMRRHAQEYSELNEPSIKLFLCDVDGTLTDSGMYYDANGNEMKKFNTRDGKGFELLRLRGIKTGFLTSETSSIVEHRAKKLKIDYLVQGVSGKAKLAAATDLADQLGLGMSEVAYIGDDINCAELLSSVGYAACPADAEAEIKSLPGIHISSLPGGHGAVRELISKMMNPLP